MNGHAGTIRAATPCKAILAPWVLAGALALGIAMPAFAVDTDGNVGNGFEITVTLQTADNVSIGEDVLVGSL